MARSGWIAVLITALLIGGLGSPPAFDQAADVDGQARPLLEALTAFPSWSTDQMGGGSDLVGPIVTKVVLLLVVVFIGAGVTGRVGSATASFLATWASVMIGAALAGGVFLAAADAFSFDGLLADTAGGAIPLTVEGFDQGVQFGLYTGWLVGLGPALLARRMEDDDEDAPPVMAGSAPGYPTVYPALPATSDWTGPLTQPVPATGTAGRTPATTRQEPQPDPAPLTQWPLWPDTPSTGREGTGTGAGTGGSGGAGRRRQGGSGGAYSRDRSSDRPSWTRWSDRG
ncbi:MAG TPA: hypothetical protein VIL36_14135 [Acidimicrobiales bacterium]